MPWMDRGTSGHAASLAHRLRRMRDTRRQGTAAPEQERAQLRPIGRGRRMEHRVAPCQVLAPALHFRQPAPESEIADLVEHVEIAEHWSKDGVHHAERPVEIRAVAQYVL